MLHNVEFINNYILLVASTVVVAAENIIGIILFWNQLLLLHYCDWSGL